MESLVVCIGEGRSHVAELVRGEREPITVGRGLKNSVVLTDPYVGECQLEFFQVDGHWLAKLHDDVNPVLVNDEVAEEAVFALSQGDRITIGRTHLDIYSAEYRVEPTRKLLFSKWLYSGRSALAVAFLTMLGVAILDGGMDYFEYAQNEEWKTYLATVLSTASIILVWAGSWALIGRVTRHQAHFAVQLLVTALVAAAILLAIPVASYVDYFLSSATAGQLAGYILATFMLALLLRWNIYFATHPARPWLSACSISVMCLVTYFGMSLLERPEFEAKPRYSTTLKPPFAPRSRGEAVDDFLASASALTDELNAQLVENPANK